MHHPGLQLFRGFLHLYLTRKKIFRDIKGSTSHIGLDISFFFKNMWMYACTLYFLFKTSPHQFFLSQSASTSVQTAQLFHQSCRPLVATAEVPERCKVQRSSVWRRLGDPSHVSLLMLSQGEVVTRPTGVTVPPPNWLSHGENGAETWIFWSPFHQLSFVSAVWWGFSQQN